VICRRAIAVAAATAATVLGGTVAPAWAATDTIFSPSETSYAGGTGPSGEFLVDAGTQSFLFNTDTDADHNVIATGRGPDGAPLFRTPLLDPGTGLPVEGTEYLAAGAYPFVCSIHDGMAGTALVVGGGALPRPDVEVTVLSRKLGKVIRTRRLVIRLDAGTAASDVRVEARRGLRPLTSLDLIDLSAGESRLFKMRLTMAGLKALKSEDSAKVAVQTDIPFGAPDTAKTKLK